MGIWSLVNHKYQPVWMPGQEWPSYLRPAKKQSRNLKKTGKAQSCDFLIFFASLKGHSFMWHITQAIINSIDPFLCKYLELR